MALIAILARKGDQIYYNFENVLHIKYLNKIVYLMVKKLK